VAYINSIKLSKKTLSLSGNDSLDMALKQLVASNNETLTLSTCLAADQKRLNQRFAYLAFMFSTNGQYTPSWFAKPNECDWTGITCTGNTVTKFDLRFFGMEGTIPDDVGLWTGLTYFNMNTNQLTGTVPKEVANWTSIKYAYFHSNMLTGVMPAFGNKFCPKTGTGWDLWADCGEIQCDCCDFCKQN
jgi:hypothetical protein